MCACPGGARSTDFEGVRGELVRAGLDACALGDATVQVCTSSAQSQVLRLPSSHSNPHCHAAGLHHAAWQRVLAVCGGLLRELVGRRSGDVLARHTCKVCAASGWHTSASFQPPPRFPPSRRGGRHSLRLGSGMGGKHCVCSDGLVDVSSALARVMSHCFCRHRHTTLCSLMLQSVEASNAASALTQLGSPCQSLLGRIDGRSHTTWRPHVPTQRPLNIANLTPTTNIYPELSQPHHCFKCRQAAPCASSRIRHTKAHSSVSRSRSKVRFF